MADLAAQYINLKKNQNKSVDDEQVFIVIIIDNH